MKVAIYYGSTTGNAQSVAQRIAAAFGRDEVTVGSAVDFAPAVTGGVDLLILGSSTWGSGDLQDDWLDTVDLISSGDFSTCKVAVFGVGDGQGWGDTFVDAMRPLRDAAVSAGAKVIGAWPSEGYDFSASRALEGDSFIGLAIDESNQAGLSDARITGWVEMLRAQMQE